MKTHRTTFRIRIARFGLATLAAAVTAIGLAGAASAEQTSTTGHSNGSLQVLLMDGSVRSVGSGVSTSPKLLEALADGSLASDGESELYNPYVTVDYLEGSPTEPR